MSQTNIFPSLLISMILCYSFSVRYSLRDFLPSLFLVDHKVPVKILYLVLVNTIILMIVYTYDFFHVHPFTPLFTHIWRTFLLVTAIIHDTSTTWCHGSGVGRQSRLDYISITSLGGDQVDQYPFISFFLYIYLMFTLGIISNHCDAQVRMHKNIGD